jgi:hypothetical protein
MLLIAIVCLLQLSRHIPYQNGYDSDCSDENVAGEMDIAKLMRPLPPGSAPRKKPVSTASSPNFILDGSSTPMTSGGPSPTPSPSGRVRRLPTSNKPVGEPLFFRVTSEGFKHAGGNNAGLG